MINLTFLEAPGFELVTDLVIRANTKGDATKMASRALEIAAIVTALQQIQTGDAAGGLVALQTALTKTSSLTPGEALAFQSLVSFGSTQLAALQQVGNLTLVGQLADTVLNNAAKAILAVCEKYPMPAPKAS